MIEIKQSLNKDYIDIKKFIDKYWKRNHILTQREDIFSHYYKYKNKITFLVAKKNSKLLGIIGYSFTNFYDQNIKINGTWIQLWIVKPNLKEQIGLRLLNHLINNYSKDFIACLGINMKTLHYYKFFKFYYNTMNQYILTMNYKKKLNSNIKFKNTLVENQHNLQNQYKTVKYLRNKYLKKKFYNYFSISIFYKGKIILNIIGRIILNEKKNYSFFRIIDFIGDINKLYYLEDYFIINKKYRIKFIDILYADIYNKKNNLKRFLISNKNNFLPLYNEPLIDKYIEKYFAFKNINAQYKKTNFQIITGDGDQDRPNI